MNVLLLDDEPGIREGLAAILRRRGHRVRTADCLARGFEHLVAETFDLAVCDWRLPDGTASKLLLAAPFPVVVVSGHPDEVRGGDNLLKVLAKPVPPADLIALVEELDAAAAADTKSPAARGDGLADLPADCRRLMHAALRELRPESHEIVDDGTYAVLRAPLAPGFESRLRSLEALGGDLRVLVPGPASRPIVELRVFRDGRPRDGMAVVAPLEAWPANAEFAVDFDREEVPPQAFLEVLDRATRFAEEGRKVHLLNVPGHLRFFAEVSGRGHDMPIREKAGPHLPEVLTSLWS